MPYTVYSTAEFDAQAEPLYAEYGEALDDAEDTLREQLVERPALGMNLGGGLYQAQLFLPTGTLQVFLAVSKASEEVFLIGIFSAEPTPAERDALRTQAADLIN